MFCAEKVVGKSLFFTEAENPQVDFSFVERHLLKVRKESMSLVFSAHGEMFHPPLMKWKI